MVKSVDTLVSGTSARKGVQVRVLFWAPKKRVRDSSLFLFTISQLRLFSSTTTSKVETLLKKLTIDFAFPIQYLIIFKHRCRISK